MALNDTHPNYAQMLPDWELMRDAYDGESAVKAKGERYLPATPGQVLDGARKGDANAPGKVAYDAYKMRAVFPDYVKEGVERFLGMLFAKEPVIELPAAMEPLRERATLEGEPLMALLRRIYEQQLATGRLGLLADLPVAPVAANPLPYIALYIGENCINWDSSQDHTGVDALTMVVLNESGFMRTDAFTWKEVERYRVLQLVAEVTDSAAPQPAVEGEEGNGTESPQEPTGEQPDDPTEGVGEPLYVQGVFNVTDGEQFDPGAMIAPMFRGTTLKQIPFVFVNSTDILATPNNPPLLGLGRGCMTIYRGEADYRYTLFQQGQDTLVTIGSVSQDGEPVNGEDSLRVGAGARIGVDLHGDAKYIGIGADGLEGQRLALEADRKNAETKAGTMISPDAGKQESGDALTTRLAAQTTSLTQIAKAGCLGLQTVLRVVAEWMGQDPEKVLVTPNLEFAVQMVSGQEITQLMAARTMGAPLSLESIHGVMADRGLTKFKYADELEKIAEEDLQRAKLVASLPQPPAPPAPNRPAPAPAKK